MFVSTINIIIPLLMKSITQYYFKFVSVNGQSQNEFIFIII